MGKQIRIPPNKLVSGFAAGQLRCGRGIGKIKEVKCPSTAYTRCQNGQWLDGPNVENAKSFLYFYGSLDTRSMKYECALGNRPLGCSKDKQGRKTICLCDTDLCNIGKGLSTYQCIRFVQSGSLCRTSNRVQGRQRSCGEKATLSAGSLAMQKR